MNKEDRAVQAQLDRTLPELNFEGVAFNDVIDFLRDVSGSSSIAFRIGWRPSSRRGRGGRRLRRRYRADRRGQRRRGQLRLRGDERLRERHKQRGDADGEAESAWLSSRLQSANALHAAF